MWIDFLKEAKGIIVLLLIGIFLNPESEMFL
jgi:hypothetical protein